MKRKLIALCAALAVTAGLALQASAASALPQGVPSAVEAAAIEKVEVAKDAFGVPYFQLDIKFPQSFMDLNAECPADGYAWIDYYWKIDGGPWTYLSGGKTDCLLDASYGFAVAGQTNTYRIPINPEDESNAKEIVIKDHTYTLKIQLAYAFSYTESSQISFIYAPFSNEVSIGSGSFYAKVSDWAKPELQNAYELGLIPDRLIGADMTKPITREEFCELAVVLYERVTGQKSEPVSTNPFRDTANPQILKAFKLGITAGTTKTTFSPDMLINREQCAVMMLNTIKAIKPDGDFSIAGVKDFPDQKYISSWAADAAKCMSKLGIITGNAEGYFMPKATTPAQEAAGYGMEAREQAIAMSARAYDKIPEITKGASSDITGLWTLNKASAAGVDTYGKVIDLTKNGEWYYFGSDGTFRYTMIISGQAGMLSGKYSINGDKIYLTNLIETVYLKDGTTEPDAEIDNKVASFSIMSAGGDVILKITADTGEDTYYRA